MHMAPSDDRLKIWLNFWKVVLVSCKLSKPRSPD